VDRWQFGAVICVLSLGDMMGNLTFPWNADDASPTIDPKHRSLREALTAIDWDFAGFNPSARLGGIHALHWYPASFPPALVASMLDLFASPGDVVLDPFCGSGVVPIEAWMRGMTAYGVDINRFATQLGQGKVDLLRSAKTEVCDRLVADYLAFRKDAQASWRSASESSVCDRAQFGSDAPKWFTLPVLRELAILKQWVNSDGVSRKWQNVLRLTASSILHGRLSVVRNYHYTYIVDRSKVKAECRTPTDVPKEFTEKLAAVFVDAALTRAQVERATHRRVDRAAFPHFENAGAHDLARFIEPGSVDIAFTSPPYFGMNDYVRSQYLSWLIFQWQGYDIDVSRESGSRRLRTKATAIDTYYDQMRTSFAAVEQMLRPGGFLIIVFGASQGTFVGDGDPVDRLKTMLTSMDFRLFWSGTRRVRFRKINNTPYRSEVLWVFERA
jgi:hypothetical protein